MESGISDYFAKNHLVLPEGWESELHLEMGYRQGGYGQYDERILQVIREEFCRNGLPLAFPEDAAEAAVPATSKRPAT